MAEWAIGVDLGATTIAAALIDRSGQVVESSCIATAAAEGSEAVLERIAAQINALLERAPGTVDGIGIGSPGQVNPVEGVVRDAVNLGWREVHLAAGARSRLERDMPIWIQKDTNAGALGEYFFGAARGCADLVYLTIGSGLGGGVITNGVLVTGMTSSASEVGHLALDPIHGRQCTCGLRGCAETVVSGPGLIAITREYLAARTRQSGLRDRSDLTTAAVINAARSGDELAIAAFDQVGQWLGMVMAVCVAVLNPATIVLGGGLGLAAFDWLAPAAEHELHRRVLAKSYQPLSIVKSQLTSSAIGAACLVWSKQRPVQAL